MEEIKTVLQLAKELETDLDKGLSSFEAEERIKKYGLNIIKEKKRISPLKIFFSQFISPLIYILVLASFISFLIREWLSGFVILGIILLNSFLGFFQEYRAERTIEKLKFLAAPKAWVIRNKKQIEIKAEEVVPGDLLVLEAGTKVCADSRLISAFSLEVDESLLTGESLPVEKEAIDLKKPAPLPERKNIVFSGTTVTKGRGLALVFSTGMKTEIGKLAKLIEEEKREPSPMEKQIKLFSKKLSFLIIFLVLLCFSLLFFFKKGDFFFAMILTLALAVAVIPEGLPALVTISLSLSAGRMLKRNVLIRKLPAAETLGSVKVVCTDKTGTLTKNEMEVESLWFDFQVYHPSDFSKTKEEGKTMLYAGVLCNNSYLDFGDPTEIALLKVTDALGLDHQKIRKAYPKMDEIPFSSERKMMTTIHKRIAFSKGSPEAILKISSFYLSQGGERRLTEKKKKEILEEVEKLAGRGLRVLAFSYKPIKGKERKNEVESQMVFLGLQAMRDPLREEAKEAVLQCQRAGIKVVMITGDHLSTAKSIAKELGLTGLALTGRDLEKPDWDKDLEKVDVFARIEPKDKLKIVEAFQKKGYSVAMTGDGVNDAPALKKADIGVAMNSGSEVAKEASEMILLDNNFASIVKGVEEGRNAFINIKNILIYLFCGNLSEIATILLALLVNLPLPLLALPILWVNLVTETIPSLGLIEERNEKVMEKELSQEKIIDKKSWLFILIMVLIISLIILTAFVFILSEFDFVLGTRISKPWPDFYLYAMTMAFTTLVICQFFNIFNFKRSFKSWFKNKYLIICLIITLALQIGVVSLPFMNKLFETKPLSVRDWLIIFLLSSFVLWPGFLVKKIRKE